MISSNRVAQRRHQSEPAFLRAGSVEEPAPDGPEPLPRGLMVGAALVRYALALLLGYFGGLKFVATTAPLIAPLVEHSPLLAWLLRSFAVEDAARVIGAVEIGAALLLLASPASAWLALLGSLLAIGTFVTTLSFLVTTPGLFVRLPGVPVPAPSPLAAFLLKDALLLAAAVWSLAVAIRVLRRRR
jgi:uncharacterized membrane protein YkgB